GQLVGERLVQKFDNLRIALHGVLLLLFFKRPMRTTAARTVCESFICASGAQPQERANKIFNKNRGLRSARNSALSPYTAT
ncbi:MAG: hypothetical protein AAF692_01155, partial [Pseudomonadota bacterium]